ncbi:mechanosensitive ion channel domain-containing protein [Burkholderia ubonensis]|uniref:mechanosensitive ion channel domain-containing protein n=1 Tax=Burkholderia ubonensis TaxID=101571 RepID=UPI0009B408D0|nr:mechanosensitive ion channel domain-containing protein [Burkholderia ubonensis]
MLASIHYVFNWLLTRCPPTRQSTRYILHCWLFAAAVTVARAAIPTPTDTSTVSDVTPALTPQQAQQVLAVLENPRARAQVETTLRTIAAVGTLGAPASAGSAVAIPAALTSNGLASMLVRQGTRWATEIGGALRESLHSLLDIGSVGSWWRDKLIREDERAILAHAVWIIVAVLVPALVLEWLLRQLLQRALIALAAQRASPSPGDVASDDESDVPCISQPPNEPDAVRMSSRGRGHALLQISMLHRMPRGVASLLLRAVPVLAFVCAGSLIISLLDSVGTSAETMIESLLDIYVVCRVVMIVGQLFFEPDASQLRLLEISDARACFAQRWIRRIVVVVGTCTVIVEVAAHLGLSEPGRIALLKVVALVGHVLVSMLIIQCGRPVGARIRAYCADRPSLAVIGGLLADLWAPVSVLIVMAMWFVWALDVHHGHHVLTTLGGGTIAVMIGMRIVSIVVFGALARLFQRRDEAQTLVQRHAYRYYPLLRQVVSTAIGVMTVVLLLHIWGVPVFRAFGAGTIGHRLASALATIAIVAVVAVVVWEAANVAFERRLQTWTRDGSLVRAARLRTLLPILRTLIFVMIALVVALTGMSELGVNVGPLLAGASIFGVALGFGSQKLVQDFITGIFLLMENAMQVGDWVTLAGVSGTVEHLSIRTMRLRAGDGSLYTIPFSSVTTVNNANRGLGNAAVKVAVAYGEDIDRAVETLKEIGAALRDDPKYRDGILSEFSYRGVDQVNGAAIVLTGQVPCTDAARWGVQREFNRRIADTFHERGIRIADACAA